MTPSLILVDAGPLIAYYNQNDPWHKRVLDFFNSCTSQFVTTDCCLTEAMWILKADHFVQNELLLDLSRGLYLNESLQPTDFSRIAELNSKYADVPADFADLSLIAISERLDISAIVSLDKDFDIYRRLGKQKFVRVFPKGQKPSIK